MTTPAITEVVPSITAINRAAPGKRPNYWALYRFRGTQHSEPTGARTLAEFGFVKDKLERMIRAGLWVPYRDRKHNSSDSFNACAEIVMNKRAAMGLKSIADERGIVRNHLAPEFGDEPMREVGNFKRIEAGFARIAAKPTIGGSTVGNIYIVFCAVLRYAAKEGLIVAMPPKLSVRDGELPVRAERRPEGWREEALFDLDEIALLLACDDIEPQYRVMYACYFLTGSRFSEITGLRVRDYIRHRKPLGQLTVKAGKIGRAKGIRYRTPPVHPGLAAWLDWWLDEGFELTHLRKPAQGDWMFPALSKRRRKIQSRLQGVDPSQLQCSHGEIYKRWQRHHLPNLKLRHRRLHDARRTMLSLIRSSEAPQEIARSITHTVIADKVLDAYTTFEWQAICKAVLSVHWSLPKPPTVSREGAKVIGIHARRRQ